MSVPHSRTASSSDETRRHIISSIFPPRDEDGIPEETLISYVKVYEEEAGSPEGGAKTRYLMLAVTKFGKVVIHKAKRNNNLSFSKGKTWQLEDMRVLEVVGPTDFALTMTIRRYQWQTERAKEQSHFLNSIVKVYKTYTKGDLPELINFGPPPDSGNGNADSRRPSSATPSPLPRNADLASPPALRTTRSGSSSSLASSAYQGKSEPSHSRTQPSLDETRPPTGGSFSRSPLDETSLAAARRPSSTNLLTNTASPRDPYSNAADGIGKGPPPRQRVTSEDRPGLEQSRKSSDASVYHDPPPSNARKPSGDVLRPISEAGSSERRSLSREREGPNGAQDVQKIQPPKTNSSVNGEAKLKPKASPQPQTRQLTPTITTTIPSPSVPQDSTHPPTSQIKPSRRASFHPPPMNTAFSREVLLTSRTGVLPGAAGLTVDEGKGTEDAILDNVEELLEGFEWTAGTGFGENGRKKGSADAIEGRLLDELTAMDSANIHAFLESDDRIAQVLGHIDEALLELEDIDVQITGYRMQLNAVSGDISFIESQNRGLQVQTSNQQALLDELRQLLQIVEVPPEDLGVLTQESPGTARGVQVLEKAAASLYKALQAGMDTANAEVAATIARMKEYQENSSQFCKRVLDYLDVTFKYQSDTTLSEYRKTAKTTMALSPHTSMGEFLMMYEGLILYVKEMDEDRYQQLCSIYMSTISQLHQSEMKDMLMNFMGSLNATAIGDPNEAYELFRPARETMLTGIAAFASAAASNAPKTSALQKSKTAIGLRASDTVKPTRKGDDHSGRVSELYQQALTQIINQVLGEEDFINAFLHLTDTESTFADHMELDSYFRRQAARHASRAMSTGMMQLVRSMMDLIFGFVDAELKDWVEAAVQRNPVAIVGIIAVSEKLAKEAEEENTSLFFAQMFDRQLSRGRMMLDAFVNEQIRTIDAARTPGKKRRGVAFFVRHFPVFVERMEAQLHDADGLPIRDRVNNVYERIINSVFGSLQQLAKTDRGEGQATEDKGQLNYHVIMIGNMRHFIDDVSQLNGPALGVYLERAKGSYEENMSTYVKLMLRRSFARLMDFFDGVERLLQSTPANEVSLHASFSRSALKKVLKDNDAKDMRKAVDVMAKRVDKQFADEDMADPVMAALVQTVWKEVTAELKKETTRAQEMIAKSYADSGLGLEFGPGDVEAACKRVK